MAPASAASFAKVVAKVRDAQPAKRGEVYQLCLQVLRATKVEPEGGAKPAGPTTPKSPKSGKRPAPTAGDGTPAPASTAKRRRDGRNSPKVAAPGSPQASKGGTANKAFFKGL